MRKSNQIITDLDTIVSNHFTLESIHSAEIKLRGHTLSELVGVAVSRAAELKTALMEIERVLDGADPQLARIRPILSVLN